MVEVQVRDSWGVSGPALELRMRAINNWVKAQATRTLEKAADDAVSYARRHVPYSSDEHKTLHLRDTIRKENTRYAPGGLGGGGFWQVNVKVGGPIMGRWPNAYWLIHGTGIYGRVGLPIYGRGAMGPILYKDKNIYLWVQKGMRPQSRWWVGAQEIATQSVNRAARRVQINPPNFGTWGGMIQAARAGIVIGHGSEMEKWEWWTKHG